MVKGNRKLWEVLKTAEKRMFAKTIIDSDTFLDMPATAQLLYFHLCMRADDDGFINNPKSIMRNVRCNEDDMRILIARQYVIPFESGIVVIKHWKIHNYIAKDRYKPSNLPEKNQLSLNEKTKIYEPNEDLYTDCIQTVYVDKDRLDKVRLDKNRLDILSSNLDNLSTEIKEIVDYLNEKSGKNYKYSTAKTKSLIKTRFNDGFVLNDFKVVIDKKCRQWLGSDMEKYLRPETLFGNKFEGYLNESDINTITKKDEESPSERAMRIRAEALNYD